MDEFNIDIIKESIEEESLFIKELIDKVHEVIVGQKDLVQKLILAVLSDGHVFLEGYPGLAKTLTIKIFSQLIDTSAVLILLCSFGVIEW